MPVLVRFPVDLDQTTRYEGTFALYVDQATGAPLPAPVRPALTRDELRKLDWAERWIPLLLGGAGLALLAGGTLAAVRHRRAAVTAPA